MEVGEAGVCVSSTVWRLASLAFWWPRQLKKGSERHQLTFCILSLCSGWGGCWDSAHVKGDCFLSWDTQIHTLTSFEKPLTDTFKIMPCQLSFYGRWCPPLYNQKQNGFMKIWVSTLKAVLFPNGHFGFWILSVMIFTVELLGKALKPQSGGEVSFLLSIGK